MDMDTKTMCQIGSALLALVGLYLSFMYKPKKADGSLDTDKQSKFKKIGYVLVLAAAGCGWYSTQVASGETSSAATTTKYYYF